MSCNPFTIPSHAEQLCERLEACTALDKAAKSFDGDEDFRVLDHELTASAMLRDNPLISLTLSVQFDAVTDEPADLQRGLIMRLRHLLDRWEARVLASEAGN